MALERVNFDDKETPITALVHGDSGAGKTYFAASWPRPWFLSVNDVQGWETIRTMNRRSLYEPSIRPTVLKLKTIRDLNDGLQEVREAIKKGDCQTVVIDSISFYCEMFYNGLIAAMQANQGAQVDTWKVYGMLNDHLRKMRIEFHNLNANVLWLAVTRQPDEASKVAMPLLKGQQAVLFPAGCKYVWYMRSEETATNVRHLLHTRRYANILARGRDGGRLPNPIVNPTYREIAAMLSEIPADQFDDQTEEEIAAELAAEDSRQTHPVLSVLGDVVGASPSVPAASSGRPVAAPSVPASSVPASAQSPAVKAALAKNNPPVSNPIRRMPVGR
jgi:hypothetical protein